MIDVLMMRRPGGKGLATPLDQHESAWAHVARLADLMGPAAADAEWCVVQADSAMTARWPSCLD